MSKVWHCAAIAAQCHTFDFWSVCVHIWTHTLPITLLLLQHMFFMYYVPVTICNLQLSYYLQCSHGIVSLPTFTCHSTLICHGHWRSCNMFNISLCHIDWFLFHWYNFFRIYVAVHLWCHQQLSAVSLEVVASLHVRAVTCFTALHSLAGSFCVTVSTWCSS